MSIVNISIKCKKYVKFYFQSLKHTSFSTWFVSSRIQICCIKAIIVTSTKNGSSFANSYFGKFNFFCDFAGSEGQKYFQNMCIYLVGHTSTITFPSCSVLVPHFLAAYHMKI